MIDRCRGTASAGLVLLVAMQLAGCAAAADPRNPPGVPPPVQDPGDDPGGSEQQGEFNAPGPFQLAVEAAGSFRPGEPVQLTLNAVSTYSSTEGEVRLVLLEVAWGEACGWAAEIRIPLNEVPRPHIHIRKPLRPGEVLRQTVTVIIPEPGYYTVNASGRRLSESPMMGTLSAREYGLLIAER